LYVINPNHYLNLNNKGQYFTVTYNKKDKSKNSKNTKPLLPFMIQKHLNCENTVGVFSGKLVSKFIVSMLILKTLKQQNG